MHRRALPLIVLFLAACSQTPQPQPEAGANAAPVVELAASSLSGEAEFGVDFSASASDPEGDALSYRWAVNGERLEVSSSALGLTFYAAGEYRVEVSVSDGMNTVSETLTVTARDELRPKDAPDVVILGFAGRWRRRLRRTREQPGLSERRGGHLGSARGSVREFGL